jgi:hypothetical protein
MTTSKLVGSFNEGCKEMGYNPKNVPIVGKIPAHFRESVLAFYEMLVITEAQNKRDNFEVDYTPGNDQWKYYPWAEVKADKKRPAGFGFSYTGYVNSYSLTDVGSRLCVGSSGRAMGLFNKHKKVYARMWFKP